MTILKGKATYSKDGKLLEEVLYEDEGNDEKPKRKAIQANEVLFHFGGRGSGNFDHKGRPGQVGGSASDSTPSPKGKKIRVIASSGKPYDMVEDMSYNGGTLPTGKKAKRYFFMDLNNREIGRLTEVSAYKDKKIKGSRLVDRTSVTGYMGETFNENYPAWERNTHSLNRSYVIDWLDSRSLK